MPDIDLDFLRTWVGRTTADTDSLSVRHARLMAATIDYPPGRIAAGEPLPPLWHWLYFLEGLTPSRLGRDGHPQRGGFLPPVPLANRMWAGGRVEFLEPPLLGQTVTKRSTIASVQHKAGRSGELVFVTVLHEILRGESTIVREEQDLVYRDPHPRAAPAAAPARASTGSGPGAATADVHAHADAGAEAQGDAAEGAGEAAGARPGRAYLPDATMLFRYSALTFNGHRIHYDADYCREVEGYPGLVVHGPLNATMLAWRAQEASGRRLARFEYRGVRPAFAGSPIALRAQADGDAVSLAALDANGQELMNAIATLAPAD